ncbi:hypothetical protein EIP91_010719 [Steccherinum ochraceum]|uniref:DUF6533 domain-containing protein n=1 Tax=Steccherinum ochraceum TaxID=92696 RepID=A0A4R0R0A0_9APHY|nr:hypothetical protein EIP91_010719 [Steccherinum ochraceum]
MDSAHPASDVTAVRFTNYLVISALTVLYYDFLLTFGHEVSAFWRGYQQWRSWTFILFVLNRHVALIFHLPVMWEFFATLSAQGVVVTGIFTTESVAPAYTMGLCDLGLSVAEGKFFAGAYGMVLLLETIILSLTLVRLLWVGNTEGNSLYALMVRDGILYFGIIAVLYAINIVTFVATGPLYKGNTVTYSSVLSSVLMNRMMLNLRSHPRSPHSSQHTTATTSYQVSAMEYATVVTSERDMIPMTVIDSFRPRDHSVV